MTYTLDDIEKMRGIGQMGARYVHTGKWDYRLELVFKDGSGRRFTCNKSYRTLAALKHDWHHNAYKFYRYHYEKTA